MAFPIEWISISKMYHYIYLKIHLGRAVIINPLLVYVLSLRDTYLCIVI